MIGEEKFFLSPKIFEAMDQDNSHGLRVGRLPTDCFEQSNRITYIRTL